MEYGKTKKKILILIDWFLPGYKAGGPIQSCANLIDRLKSDFYFSVVTRDTDFQEMKPYAGVESDKWTLSPNGVRAFYFSKSYLRIKAIRQLLLKEHFDALYLNNVFSFYFTILPLFIWRTLGQPFPVILAPRGMLFKETLGEKWIKKKIFLFLAGFLYRNVIWHASTEEEGFAVRKIFGEKATVVTASNLVLRKSVACVSKEKKPGTLRLIYWSRIHQRKNLLSALGYLKEIDPNQSIQFDIFGPIEARSYWEKCEKAIRTLPRHITVSYVGDVKSFEIDAIMRNYHFMILPTNRENFGHAILEALMNGCPVIIGDQTPWKNLAAQKAGWEIPLSDTEKFVQTISYCASIGQEEYDEWSKGAFYYALNFLNNPEIVRQNRELFASV